MDPDMSGPNDFKALWEANQRDLVETRVEGQNPPVFGDAITSDYRPPLGTWGGASYMGGPPPPPTAELREVSVIKERKMLLGEEHPDTLSSTANLASMYRNQGGWKEAAESLEVSVMKARKRVRRQEHPDTLSSMDNLASTYGASTYGIEGYGEDAYSLHSDILFPNPLQNVPPPRRTSPDRTSRDGGDTDADGRQDTTIHVKGSATISVDGVTMELGDGAMGMSSGSRDRTRRDSMRLVADPVDRFNRPAPSVDSGYGGSQSTHFQFSHQKVTRPGGDASSSLRVSEAGDDDGRRLPKKVERRRRHQVPPMQDSLPEGIDVAQDSLETAGDHDGDRTAICHKCWEGSYVVGDKSPQERFPDLPHEPWPEPDPRRKEEHRQWKKEYRTWRDVKCACGNGYYCTPHARWVSGAEIAGGLAFSKDQQKKGCPASHYDEPSGVSLSLSKVYPYMAAPSSSYCAPVPVQPRVNLGPYEDLNSHQLQQRPPTPEWERSPEPPQTYRIMEEKSPSSSVSKTMTNAEASVSVLMASASPSPHRENRTEAAAAATAKEYEARIQHWKDMAAQYDVDEDLFIVDPEAHAGLLGSIERTIIRESEFTRRNREYGVELRFDPKVFSDYISADIVRYIEEGTRIGALLPHIMESYLCLARLISHFDQLQKHGFATDYFSILIERENATAEIVPVFRSSLDNLRNIMWEIHDMASNDDKSLDAEALTWRQVAAVKEITDRLGDAFTLAGRKHGTYQSWGMLVREQVNADTQFNRTLADSRLWDCRWLVYILELGLISYAGSHAHRFDINEETASQARVSKGIANGDKETAAKVPEVGNFDPEDDTATGWARDGKEIISKDLEVGRIGIPGPPWYLSMEFSLRTLSCLDGFLDKAQVWVLSSVARRNDSGVPLSILTTMPLFADIWGPVYTVHQPGGDGSKVLQYNAGNGVIRHAGVENDQTDPSAKVVRCHWEREPTHFMGRCAKGIRRLFQAPTSLLKEGDLLLIGAPGLVANVSCPYTLDMFEEDFEEQLGVPGTRPERWEIVGLAASIVFPRYMNLSMSGTRKKVPGTTMKQAIRSNWIANPKRSNPYWLHFLYGVEVSNCTGNARRVPFKELLLHEVLRHRLEFETPGWATSDWGVAFQQALTSSDPLDIMRFGMVHQDSRERVWQLVASALEMMDDTGSDGDDLKVLLLNRHIDHLVKMSLRPNSWGSILVNSDSMATYALMTSTCLETITEAGQRDRHSICSQKMRLDGRAVKAYTCLETRLMPKTSGETDIEIRDDPLRTRYYLKNDTLIPKAAAPMSLLMSLLRVKAKEQRAEVIRNVHAQSQEIRIKASRASFCGTEVLSRRWINVPQLQPLAEQGETVSVSVGGVRLACSSDLSPAQPPTEHRAATDATRHTLALSEPASVPISLIAAPRETVRSWAGGLAGEQASQVFVPRRL